MAVVCALLPDSVDDIIKLLFCFCGLSLVWVWVWGLGFLSLGVILLGFYVLFCFFDQIQGPGLLFFLSLDLIT